MITPSASSTAGRDGDFDRLFGFDSAFLQKLERISLVNRQAVRSSSAGPRRSTQRGSSVEFADFRNYAHGDDFRRIDWNAYARLDRLFLRLYTAEQMTTVSLYLDRSASMKFGQPSKAFTAARLAAILAFVALDNDDRVSVVGWGEGRLQTLPPRTGRRAIPSAWRAIGEILASPARGTDFGSLRDATAGAGTRGLAIVFSDFLSESDWRGGLRRLSAGGQEVSAVQVLAPEEIEPELRGDWTLCDVETGAEVEVTVSPRLLRRYREELAAHTEAIESFCRGLSIPFLQLRSDTSPDDLLHELQLAGVIA